MRASLVAVLVGLSGLAGAAGAEERLLETIRAERVPADGRFEPFPRWVAPSRPTIALALSGGGARGIAHLGVLHALREDGIEIDAVAGTSAGALVGGLLAAGYRPDEIEELVATRRWNSILAGLDLRTRVLSEAEDRRRSSPLLTWRAGGDGPIRLGALANPRQFHTELYRYLLHAQRLSGGDFDRLRYRFRAVATDLLTGRQVAPARGDLAALLRGSMAFPGVFAPAPYGDAVLADGGLVENIPVETARTLGTDLVIAVDVSEEVVPTERLSGTFGTLNRSINILLRDPSERSRARADFVLRPAVDEVSAGDFETNVGPLVAAGRDAHERVRGALWDLLDSRARDGARVRFDAIEAGPGSEDAAAALVERLGPGPRTVSRLRLETELARLLDRGAFRDGRIEVVERGGRRLLRPVVEPNPPLRLLVREGGAAFGPKDPAPRPAIGEPFSWEALRRESSRMRYDLVHRGRTLLRVASAEWEPETGTLRATVVEPVFAGIEIETEGGKVLRGLERIFEGLLGKPFRFDAVASRLEEIEARGVIRGWRLETVPAGADAVRLRAIVLEDRHVEIAGSAAYRDTLGWAGLLRATATNLTGRGDSIEAIGLAAKDVAGGEVRYRSEYLGGFRNVGFEAAAAGAEIERPLVDLEQDPIWSAIEIHDSARVGAGFFRRLVAGAVVRGGIEWQREEFEAGSFGPVERRSRTVLYLSADFDRRDRLLFPSEGFAVRYEGAWPLAGDELRRNEIRLDQSVSFGGLRPVTLSFRAGAGRAENADRPAYWFDPGGFRDLYGFIPYGAQAPRYRRGGVTLRFRWLDLGAARSYVEIGADAVRTGFGGDGLPRMGETRYGYGLSATALFRGLGPITAGFARNREGAEVAFLTVGYPLGDRFLNSGR